MLTAGRNVNKLIRFLLVLLQHCSHNWMALISSTLGHHCHHLPLSFCMLLLVLDVYLLWYPREHSTTTTRTNLVKCLLRLPVLHDNAAPTQVDEQILQVRFRHITDREAFSKINDRQSPVLSFSTGIIDYSSRENLSMAATPQR
jgi:hypothetical protein